MTKIRKPISILIYITIAMLIIILFKETLPASIITWAGIIVAISCIVLVYRNQYHLAAILSCIAATGSFLFQGITVLCIPCTVIACLFCVQIFILEGPMWLLSIALLSGVFMFIAVEEPIQEKNLLYISEHCKPCHPVLQEFIKRDPQGHTWEPVVVQTSLEYLRKMGYKGKINQGIPPGDSIPVLQNGTKIINGDAKIFKYLRKEEGDNAGNCNNLRYHKRWENQ